MATPTPTIATPTPDPTLTPIPEESPPGLPETGGFPSEALYGIGALIIGAGIYLWKKSR